MLYIHQCVNDELVKLFSGTTIEKGVLLGCKTSLDCVDNCCLLPALQAGLHFYTPDAHAADATIQAWAEQEICFCGFMHSHVVDKADLSDADIIFANSLMDAFHLPILWFGLALVQKESVSFQFYAVTNKSPSGVCISPVKHTLCSSTHILRSSL